MSSLTAIELKNQGNVYYSQHESSLAIESYTKSIELILTNPNETSPPLFILYSNRSAAYIQDEDYYNGYEDAKESLKLQQNDNFKGFYRAAVCAYHLGFIKRSQQLIQEATEIYHQNLQDYSNLKFSIENKIQCMLRWRKPNSTAKKNLKNLEKIIESGTLFSEIPSILYQIRYLLRSYFDKRKDKKFFDINHGDLGLRLHELAVQFSLMYPIEKLLQNDCLFEDLILNEMPDVGLLRMKSYQQRNLPFNQQNSHLNEKASNDLTAYEFSFFINNVLASLVVNCSDERISRRALRQIHRLTTNDLYRQSLGDALSDAVNNFIYFNFNRTNLVEKFFSNYGIEILFYDYLEAACELSTMKIIKQINIGHWKKQSMKTIDFVLRQISDKIQKTTSSPSTSRFVEELKFVLNWNFNDDEQEKNLDLIIDVLTKISFIFGEKPFLDRCSTDLFYQFIKQNWFDQQTKSINEHDISFLLQNWSSILHQWINLHS